jgi:cell division septation protein DedD
MRRIFVFLFLAGFLLQGTAYAEIGRMMTKREREKQAMKDQSPEALYERINELFLREDYDDVERLSAQYLDRAPHAQHASDVAELRNLSRTKLGLSSVPFGQSASASQPVLLTPPPQTTQLKQVAFEERPFYSVQVGSFSKEENAKALVEKLIAAHYDAYLAPDAGKTGMIRVRVGKTESRPAAEILEEKLKKEGYPTKIC